ncbi:MAG: hypothetical protein O3A55_03375 [Bacteroidetes bacterium]|nr:hypothetical protein [Bacteroidota bacterium]
MKKIFISIIFISLIYGCVRDPHSVGSSLLGPDYEGYQIIDTSLIAIYDTTFSNPLLNGTSKRFLVGKTDSIETESLIKFSNDIADSLENVKIDSIQLILTPDYKWNHNLPKLTFEVGVINSTWYDSTTKSNQNFINPISSTIQFTDSMIVGKQISILLDTNLIGRWKSSKKDSLTKDWGFVIRAKSGSGIIGFSSFNSTVKPMLVIKYKKTGSDSLYVVSTSSGNDTYIAKNKISNFNDLIVQGATHFQSRIAFNLKGLGENAIINNAILELSSNSKNNILGTNSKDSLQCFLAYSKDPNKVDSISYLSILGRKILVKADTLIYNFNTTIFAQQFVRDTLLNYSFVFKTLADVELSDKFIFYNHNSQQTLRPRLKLIYSLKK